jgi:CubicO group peptidase (beta-lactamase class C family)
VLPRAERADLGELRFDVEPGELAPDGKLTVGELLDMRTGTRFREDYGVPDAEITVTDRVSGAQLLMIFARAAGGSPAARATTGRAAGVPRQTT